MEVRQHLEPLYVGLIFWFTRDNSWYVTLSGMHFEPKLDPFRLLCRYPASKTIILALPSQIGEDDLSLCIWGYLVLCSLSFSRILSRIYATSCVTLVLQSS